MKILLKCLTIIAFTLAFFGCERTPEDVESAYIKDHIEKFGPVSGKQWIIVLPGLGCTGCIQEGEEFLKNNISNKNILFVLTKVESVKILQQKVGSTLTNRPNVIIDKSDSFELPSKNSIYPLIIAMEDNKVKGYQFQSPENSAAFSRLGDDI